MIYKIKAIDQLFFRLGTPFEAEGETHLLGSAFPPIPSTYSGMFKPFVSKNCKSEYENNKSNEKNINHALKISYNGVLYKDNFCFPQPLDMFISKSYDFTSEKEIKEKQQYELKTMELMCRPMSNFPLKYCLIKSNLPTENTNEKKMKTLEDIYIEEGDLISYLKGEDSFINGFSLNNHLSRERKLGIKINSKSIDKRELDKDDYKKDNNLYEIEMVRPHADLQLAVEVKGIEIENIKLNRLGGESKIAEIQRLSEKTLNIPKLESDSKYFKLYLATPAIFENGWFPQWIDDNEAKIGKFHGKKRNIKVKLIAATVGRYVPAGGFGQEKENEKYQPREMRYAVPAGSVYYFEILEGTFEDAVHLFHQKCMSDYRLNYGFKRPKVSYDRLRYCDRGFGYVLVGTVNKEQEEKFKSV